MPDYRLFLVTADGHITTAHEFRATDDAEALERAEHLRQGAAAELWSLKRRLKVYRPNA